MNLGLHSASWTAQNWLDCMVRICRALQLSVSEVFTKVSWDFYHLCLSVHQSMWAERSGRSSERERSGERDSRKWSQRWAVILRSRSAHNHMLYSWRRRSLADVWLAAVYGLGSVFPACLLRFISLVRRVIDNLLIHDLIQDSILPRNTLYWSKSGHQPLTQWPAVQPVCMPPLSFSLYPCVSFCVCPCLCVWLLTRA